MTGRVHILSADLPGLVRVVAGVDIDQVAGGLASQEVPAWVAAAQKLHIVRERRIVLVVRPEAFRVRVSVAVAREPVLVPLIPLAHPLLKSPVYHSLIAGVRRTFFGRYGQKCLCRVEVTDVRPHHCRAFEPLLPRLGIRFTLWKPDQHLGGKRHADLEPVSCRFTVIPKVELVPQLVIVGEGFAAQLGQDLDRDAVAIVAYALGASLPKALDAQSKVGLRACQGQDSRPAALLLPHLCPALDSVCPIVLVYDAPPDAIAASAPR